ncbi:hypothetical protein HMI54_002131, partial [Coelomomyces lativittatus]
METENSISYPLSPPSPCLPRSPSESSDLCDTEIKRFLYPDRDATSNSLPFTFPPLSPSELDEDLVPIAWGTTHPEPCFGPKTFNEQFLSDRINTLVYLLKQHIKLNKKLQNEVASKQQIMNQMNKNALCQEYKIQAIQDKLKAIHAGHCHLMCQEEIDQFKEATFEQMEVLELQMKRIAELQLELDSYKDLSSN